LILLFAALLPCVVWEGSPAATSSLQALHVNRICAAGAAAKGSKPPSLKVEEMDLAKMVRISGPTVSFRGNVASPSRLPWVTLNGWRYLRQPEAKFYVTATPENAALAAAEAFSYGADAAIKTDDAGIDSLGQMIDFLRSAGESDLPALANLGYIDDGSPESGEFMNLLVRRNLLFKMVSQPDPSLAVNVKIGEPLYPRSEASNPKLLTEKVRAVVTDPKRLIRVYGTDVVIGRLLGNDGSDRLYLINYGGSRHPVPGLRVRVLGEFRWQHAVQFGPGSVPLQDVTVRDGATEFTIPQLGLFALVDLKR